MQDAIDVVRTAWMTLQRLSLHDVPCMKSWGLSAHQNISSAPHRQKRKHAQHVLPCDNVHTHTVVYIRWTAVDRSWLQSSDRWVTGWQVLPRTIVRARQKSTQWHIAHQESLHPLSCQYAKCLSEAIRMQRRQ
jgi:hypothetical protein